MADLDDIHSTLEEIQNELSRRKSGVSEWMWIILLFFFLPNWAGSRLDRWTDWVWYSAIHSADWKYVNIQKRPSDCDFFHAPIGDKGCHYKKSNYSFDNDDRSKLLNAATTEEERTRLKNIPNSVTVYWEKNPD